MIMRRYLALGLVLAATAGCTDDVETLSETASAPLTTRFNDSYIEKNAALNGVASSSGAALRSSASRINDGSRYAWSDWARFQNMYWASSTSSTVYNCNYGNWWVRIDFTPPSGEVCPFDPVTNTQSCDRTISEIDLFSLQDNFNYAGDPSPSTTTSMYGNVDFHLQYCPVGRNCTASGAGWVEPPGGYITANNKAWRSVSFTPVRATAIRAVLDCTQSTKAYVVELEAWERQPEPSCGTVTTPPGDGQPAYVFDDNSLESIKTDSDRFWWRAIEYATNPTAIEEFLRSNSPKDGVPYAGVSVWWDYAGRAAALVQMYDLLAPLDPVRAATYLERLHQLDNAFLNGRDDKRVVAGDSFPYGAFDTLHGLVMPAWGNYEGGRYQATSLMAGLFSYPMAAFARRVAEHPERFCRQYRLDAIKYTTAVLQSYDAFRQDLNFADSDPRAYYRDPYNEYPGWPMPMNQQTSFLRAVAEVAIAADSPLYRAAVHTSTEVTLLAYATNEAPRVIAKFINFLQSSDVVGSLDNGATQYVWWPYMTAYAADEPEDTNHGQFTVGGLAVIWEDEAQLDAMLARNGYPERIGATLNTAYMTMIANTFLRRIWYDDQTNVHNLLAAFTDGPNPNLPSGFYPPRYWRTDGKDGFDISQTPNTPKVPRTNSNPACAGYAALARFQPWVWVRCRDAVYNYVYSDYPGEWRALGADAHAALLRYRSYWANRP